MSVTQHSSFFQDFLFPFKLLLYKILSLGKNEKRELAEINNL